MSVPAKVMGPHKVGLRRRTPKHGARGPPSETSSKQRATRNPAGGSEEGTEGPRKPQLGPRELAPTHGVTLMDSCLTAHGEFNNCKLQRPSCSLARRAARLPCQRRHHSPANAPVPATSCRYTAVPLETRSFEKANAVGTQGCNMSQNGYGRGTHPSPHSTCKCHSPNHRHCWI